MLPVEAHLGVGPEWARVSMVLLIEASRVTVLSRVRWRCQARGVTQAYTLRIRARLYTSAGPETAFQWNYVVCATTQYAQFVGNDSVTCVDCPPGGDCSGLQLTDVTTADTNQSDVEALRSITDSSLQVTQQYIVAMPGYWSSASSTGLAYYECPNTEACLPGNLVNGRYDVHTVTVLLLCTLPIAFST